MTKNLYKILIILLMFIMSIALSGTSKAADAEATGNSCKFSLIADKVDKAEVKKGESVTILLKVSEIKAKTGIAALSTALVYDPNVFDCTVSSDDEEVWTKQGFIEDKILSMTKSDLNPTLEDQTIAKIKLTAKVDAIIGENTLKLTGITCTIDDITYSYSADIVTTLLENNNPDDNKPDDNNPDDNKPDDNNPDDNKPDDNKPDDNNPDDNDPDDNKPDGNNPDDDDPDDDDPDDDDPDDYDSDVDDPDNDGSDDDDLNNSNKPGTNNITNDYNQTSNSYNINNNGYTGESMPKTGIKNGLIVVGIGAIISAIVFYIKYKRTY